MDRSFACATGAVNIVDTAPATAMQPACDVSNCEHLLSPAKPLCATLSPARINNRKQQQSLAQVRMSQKVLSSSQNRHKNYPRRYRACLLNLAQASRYRGFALYSDFFPRFQALRSRQFGWGYKRVLLGLLRGSCEGFASAIVIVPPLVYH